MSHADAFDLSERYTLTVLGADAAYRERPGGGDQTLETEGLVPVHWTRLRAEPLSLDKAAKALADLAAEASGLHDPRQRDWLTEQALATRQLLRWVSGENLSYEDVVAACLRVPPQAPSAAQLMAHRARLDEALERAGFPSGPAGIDAYHEQDRIPSSEVQTALQALLDEGRERVGRYHPQLTLHAEPIRAQVVHGVPFSAYCDYPGRRVWLNGDFAYTRSALKHLVGHEAYPGHDVHMAHREHLTVSGKMPIDGALVLTNSASSVLYEGIAEAGLDLIHWRDTPLDLVEWHLTRLQQLCSIEAAHALNTGRQTPAEVAGFLRATIRQTDIWIEARLRFFTHRLRAPFIYSYWWGNELTSRFWQAVSALNSDRAVAYLYEQMHSPSTLFAHWIPGGQP